MSRQWRQGRRLRAIGTGALVAGALLTYCVVVGWALVAGPVWGRVGIAAVALTGVALIFSQLRSGLTVRTRAGARLTVIATPDAVELTDFSRWSSPSERRGRHLQLDAQNLATEVLEILNGQLVVCAVSAPRLREHYHHWGFTQGASRRLLSRTSRLTPRTTVMVREPHSG